MIKYPATCLTNGSKMAWLLRAQELLRQEHNVIGKWHREGLTLAEYQTLRAEVQISFPYTETPLSKTDWDSYKTDRFTKKQNLINEGIGLMKSNSFASTTYSPNLDDDIKIDG